MALTVRDLMKLQCFNHMKLIAGEKGLDNNLLELIAEDSRFPVGKDELDKLMEPSLYVGRAPSQVTEFVDEYIKPVIEENKDLLGIKAEINV